jgi:Ca-activated chloride channel family protein
MRLETWLVAVTMAGVLGGTASGWPAQDPEQSGAPVFRSSIDLVRVSAVVRDRKGRFVRDLKKADFEIFDGDQTRPITDFHTEDAGISMALLFDVSGSMENRMTSARETASLILGWLTAPGDESAVFTFDTRLDEVRAFEGGAQALPDRLSSVKPFGATSLHDAIARAAERVASRESLRRAVVVFTDGLDNASRLTAAEVSGIASAIDVPVYIVGVVPAIDNPSASTSVVTAERSAFVGSLGNLAFWTGGEVYVVSTFAERGVAARQLVDELRHQYLLAFEAGMKPGWHRLQLRMRNKDLTVRSRSGYIAGQSRPIS